MKKRFDDIYGARVMYLLLKPFKDQKAYDLGLIDAQGNLTSKKPKFEDEQEALTVLHKVVFSIKQMVDKLPSNKTKLKQLAVALHFVNQKQIPLQFQEDCPNLVPEYLHMLEFVIENELRLIQEEIDVRDAMEVLSEEGEGAAPAAAPTNSVAGVEPHDQPVIDPKKKKKGLEYDRLFARQEEK